MSKMTIETDAVGRYHISIGVGKIYSTRDIAELTEAVDHYFNGNNNDLGNNPKCPLCRAINDEMAKKISSPARYGVK